MAEEREQRAPPRSPGELAAAALSAAKGKAAEAWDNLRVGDGHAGAMGRLGWKELRNALSWEGRQVADTEIGLYGSATQGEIASARGDTGLDAEEERKSVLGYPLQQGPDQGQGRQQGRDGHGR